MEGTIKIVFNEREFKIKRWTLVVFCSIAVVILVIYAALIGTANIPNVDEIDEDSKRQEIINKVFDAIFYILGAIAAITTNYALAMTFFVLTLITKYIALREAIDNPYFWPYAVWSILTSIVAITFIRDLRKLEAIKKQQRQKCPFCPHCTNSGTVGYVPPVISQAPPPPAVTTYPQQYPQLFEDNNPNNDNYNR